MVLAGIILAEAAGVWQTGLHVVQTVSYGPQVRGGLSSAEVVISPEEIDHPKPIQLDLLIPFAPEAAADGARALKPDGVLLRDPEIIQRRPHGWVADLPLTRLAVETTGRAQMANVVALGATAVLTPHLNVESMTAALRERAPKGLVDPFLKAMTAGVTAAEKVKGNILYEDEPSTED